MHKLIIVCAITLCCLSVSAETIYQGQFELITGDVVSLADHPFLLEAHAVWNTNDYLLGLAYFGPKIKLGKRGSLFALTGAAFDNTGQLNVIAALWHVAQIKNWNFIQIADMYFPVSDGETQFFLATQGQRGSAWQVGYRAEALGVGGETVFVSAGPIIRHDDLKLRLWLAADVYRADEEDRVFLRVTKVF